LDENRSALLSTYGGLLRLDLSARIAARWQLDAHGFLTVRLADKRFTYLREGERRQAYALSRWGAGAALGVSRSF
jgi:hypothetical protein